MRYIFYLVTLLSFQVSAQSSIEWIDDFKSGDRIYDYGFEDYPTIDLYKKILSDTHNIIIVEGGYFKSNEWAKISNNSIGAGESKLCDDIDASLKDMTRIYEYNSLHRIVGNDLQFLELLNPEKFDSILSQLSLDKTEVLKGNIPLDKQVEFIKECVNRYSLILVDSLLLSAIVYNVVLESEDFVKAGIDKKIFFVRDYLAVNSQTKFENSVVRGSYLCVPRRGSNNLKGSNLNCKNRLPKKQEFEKLNFADLPSKIRFTKRIRIRKKDYKDFKFIYIDKLNNCLF